MSLINTCRKEIGRKNEQLRYFDPSRISYGTVSVLFWIQEKKQRFHKPAVQPNFLQEHVGRLGQTGMDTRFFTRETATCLTGHEMISNWV